MICGRISMEEQYSVTTEDRMKNIFFLKIYMGFVFTSVSRVIDSSKMQTKNHSFI
jgi:hypothetical protein